MHPILQCLLDQQTLKGDYPPSQPEWNDLLERLSQFLSRQDEEYALLQHSLEVASQEIRTLFETSRSDHQEQISVLTRSLPDPILHVDREGNILHILSWGQTCFKSHDHTKHPGSTLHLDDLLTSQATNAIINAVTLSCIQQKNVSIGFATKTPSDTAVPCEARIVPLQTKEGTQSALCVLRNTENAISSTPYADVIKKIFDEATEGIAIHFLDENRINVNQAFCHMLQHDCTEVETWDMRTFRRHFSSRALLAIRHAVKTQGRFQGEAVLKRRDQSLLTVWLSIDTIYDNKSGLPTHRVAMVTDISQLEASRKQLHFFATHDQLTQLPNRTLLLQKLDTILTRHRRQHHTGALLFVDLDNFKSINDMAGHTVGDRILIECTSRIAQQLRSRDTFGRLGGDEFLIILENIHHRESAAYIARKILHALKEPFVDNENIFELGASIGITFFPENGTKSETLIHQADLAMYQAKKRGKNRFQYYNRSFEMILQHDYTIEQSLRSALDYEGFHLLYQPIIDATSGRIVSVEALLRLRDKKLPAHNAPDVFIPVAERSGLVLQIGQWVFDKVCRQLSLWREHGMDDLVVAVNLSRRQLSDESWSDFVSETLQHYHLAPSIIDFEITETALMASRESSYETIRKLKQSGFRIAIDDFGTGYSSLANLKHFSTDKLKIDKSFIGGMMNNESDQAIVAASVALGHALGLKVVAEGVETDEQHQHLLASGCDEMQGFLLGRPTTPEEIQKLYFNPSKES